MFHVSIYRTCHYYSNTLRLCKLSMNILAFLLTLQSDLYVPTVQQQLSAEVQSKKIRFETLNLSKDSDVLWNSILV